MGASVGISNTRLVRRARMARLLLRHFGTGWLAYRVAYAARLRAGLLRRQLPCEPWEAHPLQHLLQDPALAEPERYLAYRRSQESSFFFRPADRAAYQPLLHQWADADSDPIEQAHALANGELDYFEHTRLACGFPPDWHSNPLTQVRVPNDRHWSQIGDFGHGDIKIIWEPSRFGFAFTLVRAYWRTGDERYPELFWQAVESWRAQNPPQQGPNWKCGQEASFRVMAWCFALYGFLEAAATTAERVAQLVQMLGVHGQRIEANIGYAISQRNNHGISEGVGLWTIGLLFPELRDAVRWRDTGRQVLEQLARELIYNDGAFSQHSVNYHRVMLHNYLWAIRLGECCGQPLSAELESRVAQASQLLYQLQDETSGQLPNYGQNDGALVLPLSSCDYRDYRPVISAAHYGSTEERCYTPGPWDEDLLWLYGPQALRAPIHPPARRDLYAPDGGYHTLRTPTSFAFIRCATFRDRPAQADMLHLDLWWRGQNVALDAGTYSYNAPAPWNNALAETAYHNTVSVDGRDQMERAGKFLWLPWLNGRVRQQQRTESGLLAYFAGEHDGYTHLPAPVLHHRALLRIGDEHWLVLDRMTSTAAHQYRLHWLLADVPYRKQANQHGLTLELPAGTYHITMGSADGVDVALSIVRADEQTPRGWQSPYYWSRRPAISCALNAKTRDLLLWTLLGPEAASIQQHAESLQIKAETWTATIELAPESAPSPLLRAVLQDGAHTTMDVLK